MSMKKGDLKREYKISNDTLRYYEKIGLIHPQIDSGNHRHYNDDLQILKDIYKYRSMGFEAKEIKSLLNKGINDEVFRDKITELRVNYRIIRFYIINLVDDALKTEKEMGKYAPFAKKEVQSVRKLTAKLISLCDKKAINDDYQIIYEYLNDFIDLSMVTKNDLNEIVYTLSHNKFYYTYWTFKTNNPNAIKIMVYAINRNKDKSA